MIFIQQDKQTLSPYPKRQETNRLCEVYIRQHQKSFPFSSLYLFHIVLAARKRIHQQQRNYNRTVEPDCYDNPTDGDEKSENEIGYAMLSSLFFVCFPFWSYLFVTFLPSFPEIVSFDIRYLHVLYYQSCSCCRRLDDMMAEWWFRSQLLDHLYICAYEGEEEGETFFGGRTNIFVMFPIFRENKRKQNERNK